MDGNAMRRAKVLLLIGFAALIAALTAACVGPQALPTPTPTRTPVPTFTPTPEGVTLARAFSNVVAVIPPTPTPTPTWTPTPTPTDTPTPTPTPKPEVVVQSQRLNVRLGPNTRHPRVAQVSQGQRLDVIGKTPDGTWWQVRLADGTVGWVYASLVEPEGAIESVPVAANIPTPPPTPTFTPTPIPTPTFTPTPAYMFNKVVIYGCEFNAGVTEVHGTVYVDGKPANGYWVAFSWKPDGPIVAKIQSGPHPGYPDWPPGFYSHILQARAPREGDWYFWIVDENNRRISRIAHVRTDAVAEPGKCQKWTIDFDTR